MARSKTKLNLKPLDAFMRGVKRAPPGGPIDRVYRQWGARYLAFTRRRFAKQSRGGGDWTPLKPATIKRRRKGKGKGASAAILRDTSTLFGALTIGAPGNLFKRIRKGIRVGFGGPARYVKGKGGHATITRIAQWHQEGKGNLPERKILVEPDAATVRRMMGDAKRGFTRLGRSVERLAH